MSEKLEFVYLLKPVKKATSIEEYMEMLSDEENLVLKQHFSYMNKLQESGKIVIGGPCLDAAYLIIILKVESRDEAQYLIEQDPAIKSKLVVVESYHPFRTAVQTIC